tara:strand:- start:697 stop:1299 length:603 start_codon:yes stop_codon:yes gene_type:complete
MGAVESAANDVANVVEDGANVVANTAKDGVKEVEKTAKNIGKVASKAIRGIKEGAEFTVRGVKRTVVKTQKGLKRAGFNSNFAKDFKKGFLLTARALQYPQKYIDEHDPLKPYLGGFAPLGFAASFGLSPITTIGFLEELSVNPDLQKKVRDGDVETIAQLALSPLAFLPPGGGSVGKAIAKKSGKNAAALAFRVAKQAA